MAGLFFSSFLQVFGFFAAASHFRKLTNSTNVLLISLVISIPLFIGSGAKEIDSFFQYPLSFLTGVVFSLPFIFALEGIASAGRMIDLFRGAQFGEQMSPITGVPTSILENFFIVAGVASFFIFDLHHFAFSALQASIDLSYFNQLLALELTKKSSLIFYFALILAVPVLVTGMLTDLFSSILARTMPQISVVFEILPIKLVIGLLVLAFAFESGYLEEPLTGLITGLF